MGRKRADAFGDSFVVVRKSLGLELLAVKARNNGICGDQAGKGVRKGGDICKNRLIHLAVEQKLTQHCKTTIFQ